MIFCTCSVWQFYAIKQCDWQIYVVHFSVSRLDKLVNSLQLLLIYDYRGANNNVRSR